MALAGTFILAFGWFGFNPGSTLAGGDLRIAVVATNTMLAGDRRRDLRRCSTCGCGSASRIPACSCNGMLAGLVAITAPCAFVNSVSAVIIGVDRRRPGRRSRCCSSSATLKIDDPVGAISVHGVNGAWGVLSLGLFADGTYGDGWNGVPGTVKGLFYGDASQFAAQCVGTLTCIVFVFVQLLRLLQGRRRDHRQPRLGGGRDRGSRHSRDGRAGLSGLRARPGNAGWAAGTMTSAESPRPLPHPALKPVRAE